MLVIRALCISFYERYEGKKSGVEGKHLLIQEDDFKCGKLKLWNVAKRDEDKWKNLCTGCGKKAKYETTTDWEKNAVWHEKEKKYRKRFSHQ